MKKTYINPNIEVVMIATQKMLAESFTISTTEKDSGLGRENDGDDW